MKVEGTGGWVEIPETAGGWELYSSMPGSKFAAKRLASAAKKAVCARTRDEAIKIMGAALDFDARFGARDTEPRGHAEVILEKGRGGDFRWAL